MCVSVFRNQIRKADEIDTETQAVNDMLKALRKKIFQNDMLDLRDWYVVLKLAYPPLPPRKPRDKEDKKRENQAAAASGGNAAIDDTGAKSGEDEAGGSRRIRVSMPKDGKEGEKGDEAEDDGSLTIRIPLKRKQVRR